MWKFERNHAIACINNSKVMSKGISRLGKDIDHHLREKQTGFKASEEPNGKSYNMTSNLDVFDYAEPI